MPFSSFRTALEILLVPFAFNSSEATRYPSGMITVMMAYCIEIMVLALFALHLAFQNRLKDEKATEMSAQEAGDRKKALMGFRDLTDRENPLFGYSY
jgi:hypothetical protein